jgi:hypothetical protein
MRFIKLLKIIKNRSDTGEAINEFDMLPAAQDVISALVNKTTVLSNNPARLNYITGSLQVLVTGVIKAATGQVEFNKM